MNRHLSLLLTVGILITMTACRQTSIEAQLDALCTPLFPADEPGAAVAIIRGNDIVCRTYGLATLDPATPVTDSTCFNIASCSKQFTAVAILQLAERGLLDIHKPIADQPFGLTDSIWKQVTISHLLSHSSGVPDERSKYFTREERLRGNDAMAMQYIHMVNHLHFAPGSAYEYINPTFVLLGDIVEKTSEQPFADYMSDHLFRPTGMSHTTYFDPEQPTAIAHMAHGYEYMDVSDMPEERTATEEAVASKDWYEYDYGEETFFATRPDGGLYSSLQDLIQWEMALRKVESHEDESLLSSTYLCEAMTPHICVSGSMWSDYQNRDNTYYGYGWFIEPYDTAMAAAQARPAIYHTGDNGGFKILIARYPTLHSAIIILSNRADWDRYGLKTQLEQLLLE